ncbi:hypothetical protein BG011_003078 [Mortierella polycephala]|uniref:Uncharacterized protein n=1 Tax=Mortierella polycephala TaxID=41804 RepID=A0A9P6Q4I6_9FUNG|nr:hypothetical protein BG011_003078 [Mortierella polycephala]
MRPDPHKQAASRKYHNKVKNRGGGSAAGATTDSSPATGHTGNRGGSRGGARGGRGGRGGYRGWSKDKDQQGEEDGEDGDDVPRKSYARRKIVSNADRYIELDEEVIEAEELDQGVDRQTIAFREMLKDSDQKKTFDPAAYFRFKAEKEVESQDGLEESQQTRKLLEVRLDDIENALMTLSIKDRLLLRDSDVKALERDMVGKVSLSTGKPIVPKLVRGQAASDILIKPSPTTTGNTTPSTTASASYNKAISGPIGADKQASMDADLDELLDTTKTYGRARQPVAAVPTIPSTAPSQIVSPGSKVRLSPLPKGPKSTGAPSSGTTKGLPPLLKKKGAPASLGGGSGKNDEEWLDSVLGI